PRCGAVRGYLRGRGLYLADGRRGRAVGDVGAGRDDLPAVAAAPVRSLFRCTATQVTVLRRMRRANRYTSAPRPPSRMMTSSHGALLGSCWMQSISIQSHTPDSAKISKITISSPIPGIRATLRLAGFDGNGAGRPVPRRAPRPGR